jgi:hypothetical protein
VRKVLARNSGDARVHLAQYFRHLVLEMSSDQGKGSSHIENQIRTNPEPILHPCSLGTEHEIADLRDVGLRETRDIRTAELFGVVFVCDRAKHELPASLFRRECEDPLLEPVYHGPNACEAAAQFGVAVPGADGVDDQRSVGSEALIQRADEEDVEDWMMSSQSFICQLQGDTRFVSKYLCPMILGIYQNTHRLEPGEEHTSAYSTQNFQTFSASSGSRRGLFRW